MKRCKTLHWCMCMVLLLHAPSCIRTQFIGRSTTPKSYPALEIIAPKGAKQPTYFFMDPNGSYKYAFDTGSGIASEQSANQANEVTGQYSYFENGVPYMVKYKAGIQGYQAEIIPGSTTAPQTKKNTAFAVIDGRTVAAKTAAPTTTNTAAAAAAAAGGGGTLPILSQTSHLSVRSTLPQVSGNSAATLQFVQNMVRTMQSQPIQLSFSSQQRGLPLTANANAAAAAIVGSTRGAATRLVAQSPNLLTNIPTSVNKAGFQQINSLAATPQQLKAAAEQLRQPYAFSYSSEQSARSESADQSGNVIGKYSYYDEAGFHELNYKAGDGIGFVVLGGNLAAQKDAQKSAFNSLATTRSPFLSIPINVQPQPQPPHPNYSYSILPADSANTGNIRRTDNAESIRNRNSFEQNGRSLRKFRRHVKW